MLTFQRANQTALVGETPMLIAMLSTSLIIQSASPRPATSSQNPTTGSQDLQTAARDLREAIRNNINQEVNAQRAQAAAKAAAAQAGSDATPTPPTPGQIRIQGPDGQQTIVVPPFGRAQFGRDTIPPQAVDITLAFFIT